MTGLVASLSVILILHTGKLILSTLQINITNDLKTLTEPLKTYRSYFVNFITVPLYNLISPTGSTASVVMNLVSLASLSDILQSGIKWEG